jgi:hypothetical protein
MTLARVPSLKITAVITSGLGLLIVLGCADNTGLAKRYPVSGKVSYKGAPVAKGRVDFIPAKGGDGRTASGDILDGNYTLTTAEKDDGALPGSYKVTVTSAVLDPAAEAALKEQSKGGQYRLGPETKDIMKGAVKSLLPSKFSLPETSGLTAEVKEQPNTIDLNLPE